MSGVVENVFLQREARRAVPMVLSLLLLAAGCRIDPNSARGVAEQFVDQHYVRIDLRAAKPFTAGLALKKIEHEQHLTAGHSIDEATRLPTVRYRLLQEHGDSETASFVFEGTISVPDADPFKRKWIITTRQTAGTWKVSNFEETD